MTPEDYEDLRPHVVALPPDAARRFALVCAQRAAEVHRRADPPTAAAYDELLEVLWEGGDPDPVRIDVLLRRADDVLEVQAVVVDHTTACLAYASRTVGDISGVQASWCAQQLCDLVDEWVLAQDRVQVVDPAAEARVRAHPVFVAEMARLARDLAAATRTDLPSAELRARAREEGQELAAALQR